MDYMRVYEQTHLASSSGTSEWHNVFAADKFAKTNFITKNYLGYHPTAICPLIIVIDQVLNSDFPQNN